MKHQAIVKFSTEETKVEQTAERLRKCLLTLRQRLTSAGASTASREAIKEMIREIESLQREERHVLKVPLKDEYEAKAMESIIPKLPALIDQKRKELSDADIERFVEAVMPPDPLKDVLLDFETDNIKLRKWFVKKHNCLDSKAVNKNAGYSSANEAQTASRWKSKNQIFSADYFGRELFPAFQFENGKPLQIIKKILEIFGKELSSWQIAFWFVAENSWLDGRRPVDMLKKEQEVLEASRREVEHAYY